MAKKSIYFCIDTDSYTEQMISNRGACGYYDYMQTEYAIRRGITPMVVSNMAFFDFSLVLLGYDIYLCYKEKKLKIEPNMEILVRLGPKATSKTVKKELHCDAHGGLCIEGTDRYYSSLLSAFDRGLFHATLGIQPYNPKPKFELCKICGNCGYFMRFVKTDGTPDHLGDCGSIGMNKACYEGVNPFNSNAVPILQVAENEEPCGFFKVKRTERIRKYIKAHPGLYVQEQ